MAETIEFEAFKEVNELTGSESLNILQGRRAEFDESDKRMLPCHNYVVGFCEKGANCLFYHPAPEDLATSIRSPPFPEGFGTREAVEAAVKDMAAHTQFQTQRSRSGPSGYGRGMKMNPDPSRFAHHRQRVVDPYVPPFDSYDYGYQEQYQEPSGYPEAEVEHQTMFDHIDWMQFLAPGQVPPPIVSVALQEESPIRKRGRNLLEMMVAPPGVTSPSSSETTYATATTKMSAKEELRFKFSQLAVELKLENGPKASTNLDRTSTMAHFSDQNQ